MLTRATRFCLLVLLVLLASFATAAAQTVALGSDYFQTVPGNNGPPHSGTDFNFGPGIGIVDFMGVPMGGSLGNTDTIVQRQADATINGGAIPIQLVALSLASTGPVNVGGNFYNVSLTLNQAFASTGMISIMGSTSGGTFSSLLNVYFDAMFKPVAGGNPFDVKSEVTLQQTGAAWSPTLSPTNGAPILVRGPYGDQQANLHSNLPAGEVDFFIDPNLMECNIPGLQPDCHVVIPAVPEPSVLLLIVPAVVGMFWKLGMKAGSRP